MRDFISKKMVKFNIYNVVFSTNNDKYEAKSAQDENPGVEVG